MSNVPGAIVNYGPIETYIHNWLAEQYSIVIAYAVHEALWGIPCGPHPAMVEPRMRGLSRLLQG